jgi:hypothetical protein
VDEGVELECGGQNFPRGLKSQRFCR